MKVLFIYPSIGPVYPLQIAALSAFIKQKGHQVRLLSFELGLSTEISRKVYSRIKKEIGSFDPDFVAFSCYEMSYFVIKKISRYIKKRWPRLNIIVGGYYPTLAPEDVISCPAIDIICIGEGERPLATLLNLRGKGKKTTKINNLWFKKGKKIIKNPVGPLIECLDDLPFPDRELLDYQAQIDSGEIGQRTVKVMATRGCPYSCTYCGNKYFRLIYPNKHKYLRFRTPENVISEIKRLKEEYHFDIVGFQDDNLTLDINWLKIFAKLYKKEIGVPFYCATRIEPCSDQVLNILKRAGCYLLLIGVESGDEKYRRELMKRYMTNKRIMEVFRKARQKKLLTWSFTMVGLPFQNRRTILKTLWLNWRCRPDFVMSSIFYPLKGTELGDICYQNGWVNFKKREKVTSIAWQSILDHPILSETEIRLAKYLNSLTASRSKFFWNVLFVRLKNLLIYRRWI